MTDTTNNTSTGCAQDPMVQNALNHLLNNISPSQFADLVARSGFSTTLHGLINPSDVAANIETAGGFTAAVQHYDGIQNLATLAGGMPNLIDAAVIGGFSQDLSNSMRDAESHPHAYSVLDRLLCPSSCNPFG